MGVFMCCGGIENVRFPTNPQTFNWVRYSGYFGEPLVHLMLPHVPITVSFKPTPDRAQALELSNLIVPCLNLFDNPASELSFPKHN